MDLKVTGEANFSKNPRLISRRKELLSFSRGYEFRHELSTRRSGLPCNFHLCQKKCHAFDPQA